MTASIRYLAIAAAYLIAVPAGAFEPATPPRYKLSALMPFGGPLSTAANINQLGDVVGSAYSSNSSGRYAFLYSNGSALNIGNAFSDSPSDANAVNDLRQVVGGAETAQLRVIHAFVYSEGVMTDLNPTIANASRSEANDINESGEITGTSRIGSSSTTRGFLYRNGASIDIRTLGGASTNPIAINNAGQVVGQSSRLNGTVAAFLYSGNAMTEVPTPGVSSIAYDINNAGQIVGEFKDLTGHTSAFFYSNGNFKDIGALYSATSTSSATGINEKGEVVGELDFDKPFLYTNDTIYPIADLLDDSGIGWTLTHVGGINDKGWIPAIGTFEGGLLQALLLTPVPEPVNLALGATAAPSAGQSPTLKIPAASVFAPTI